MKEYTKTITVQAVQWTGENLEEVEEFCWCYLAPDQVKYPQLLVITGVDDTADPCDWVLKEPNQKYADEVVSNADFTRDYKEVSE